MDKKTTTQTMSQVEKDFIEKLNNKKLSKVDSGKLVKK